MQGKRLFWFGVVMLMVFVRESIAAQVVGFTTPFEQAHVAVRCRVAANSTIYGITFCSNDATVFPRIALVADGGGSPLPRMGLTLRSVQAVATSPGRASVAFEPYWCAESGFLWLVIQFPRELITAEGPGGGAGLGWVRAPHPLVQRSFYCVDGDIGEFTEGLDVSFLTAPVPIATTSTKSAGPRGAPETPPASLKQLTIGDGRTVEVAFQLLLSGPTTLAVFDVAGRHVRTLLEATLDAGDHRCHWNGLSTSGSRVASGIYFLILKTQGSTVRGKVVILR